MFNKCKKCRECCQNTTTEDFKIQLTNKERKILGEKEVILKAGSKCKYLGENGCVLKNKPLICEAYPLILHKGELIVSGDCPLGNRFKKQIVQDTLEFHHLIKIKLALAPLKKNEVNRLERTYNKRIGKFSKK